MGWNKDKKHNGIKIRRLGGVFIICLLVLTGVTSITRVAHADPHGMYYTAIGQQQLFFNVLAALDQADYVETSLSREDRREAREQIDSEPPFIRETESGARLTEATEVSQDGPGVSPSEPDIPGEPSLTNRQITLEGADLYTDQLVRQFGAESARRNAAADLLIALCASGFGYQDCQYDLDSFDSLRDEVKFFNKSATIRSPIKWAQLPLINGVWAALNSGNTTANISNPDPEAILPGATDPLFFTDEEYRENKSTDPALYGYAPYAYSAEIDYWRRFIDDKQNTSTPEDYQGHKNLFDVMYNNVAKEYLPNAPVLYPYQEYIFANGVDSDPILMGVSEDPSVCGGPGPCLNTNVPPWSLAAQPGMTLPEYLIQANDMRQAGTDRMYKIASEAAARITVQQDMIEDEGIVAKTTLETNPITELFPAPLIDYPLSEIGELSTLIRLSVAAREASIYGIPNVLGMLATSQQASSLEGLDIPGAVQLVKRDGSSSSAAPTSTPTSTPTPLGTLNTSEQVAGTLDWIFDTGNMFDAPKRETSPSANIISPILEYGARHALQILTSGNWRWGGGAGYTAD